MIEMDYDQGMVRFREGEVICGHLPTKTFKAMTKGIERLVDRTHQKATITVYLNRMWNVVAVCYWHPPNVPMVHLSLSPRIPPKYTVDWLPGIPKRGNQ